MSKSIYKGKSRVKEEDSNTLKYVCGHNVPDEYKHYFETFYKVYKRICKARKLIRNDSLDELSLEELKSMNYKLYKEVLNNSNLFLDNSDELHTYMSILLYNLVGFTSYVFMNKNSIRFKHYKKFLIEILEAIKEKDIQKVEKIYKKHVISDRTLELKSYDFIISLYPNENSFENFLVNSEDLNNYNYLYKYGQYITDSHLQLVDYFNKVDSSKILNMARTTIEGFNRGIINQGINISKKTYVVLKYPIGFEKVALECQNQLFKTMGLKTLLKVIPAPANKQLDFSHKNNGLLNLSDKFIDKNLEFYKKYFKDFEKELSSAGTIYIETFGEEEFKPDKFELIKPLEELINLKNKFDFEFYSLYRKYNRPEESSFTIISYPSPEIDRDNFEEIFDETIKLNTLDNEKWIGIQQKIIDVLDEGTKVKVVGKTENKTNMIVSLHSLNERETNFENCSADVNIPVGEVFTSPVLKDTNGIIHVSKVFLNGLEYKDLYFEIKDGLVVDYNCSNYDNEEDNKNFIKETILRNYDSLPIGEFAIGTNTAAYAMSKKYNIQDKLDILIAEKTGPHFALGDTCYAHQEDLIFYNPDGKEIIAKENEISSLRKNNIQSAYFNCHTDITIPYDEIRGIYSLRDDGTEIPIILDGKFVLEGTTELNDYLD